MINSKKYKHNKLLRDIQDKIEFKRQINAFDLEKLLALNSKQIRINTSLILQLRRKSK